MKLFSKAADGGANSGVTGYFLVEIKSLFSIVVLRFNPGSREAFHEHAFNAWTLWLKGRVWEHCIDEVIDGWKTDIIRVFTAGQIKHTPRTCFHKIIAGDEGAWALSFRGPWADRWRESRAGRITTLTHGRKEVTPS